MIASSRDHRQGACDSLNRLEGSCPRHHDAHATIHCMQAPRALDCLRRDCVEPQSISGLQCGLSGALWMDHQTRDLRTLTVGKSPGSHCVGDTWTSENCDEDPR
jgi:hypothetical protein